MDVDPPPYPLGLLLSEPPVVVDVAEPEVLLPPALSVGVPPFVLSTPPNPAGTLGLPLPEAELAALM